MGLGKARLEKIVLALAVVLLAGIVIHRYHPTLPSPQKENAFATFKSSNPALDFTFEYPVKEWTPKESRGSAQKYDAVQILGPLDPKEEYRVYISVGVRALKPGQSGAELPGLFLEEMKRFKGFKVLEEKKARVLGRDYPSVTFEHFLRLPFWKKNAKDVLMKQAVVFLTRHGRSYRISWAGTAGQFSAYRQVFDHMLETFEFKD